MRGDTKPRILVAEDNDVILEIMEIMLKDKYDLVTATNGKDAVDRLQWDISILISRILVLHEDS